MSGDQLIYSVVTRSALLPDLRAPAIYRYRARITARRVIFSIDGPNSESGVATPSLISRLQGLFLLSQIDYSIKKA